MINSSEYMSWVAMVQRCTNHKNHSYKDYGQHGITVCDRWRDSFQAFYDDMQKRPSKNHTLDRIDNNGNYEPSNCRWATKTQQQRNTRINRLLTHAGKTMCISAWSEETGLAWYIIQKRIDRGWSEERTLTTPSREYKKKEINSD